MPSYKDYMQIQNPNSMDDKDLRKAIVIMASAANKRLKRMENADVYYGSNEGSESISGVTKFGVGTKKGDELNREFKRVRNFLANEQSSLTGMYKVYKGVKEAIKRGRERIAGKYGLEDSKSIKDYNKMRKQKAASALPTERKLSRYEELRKWRKTWDYYNKLKDEGYYAPSQYDSNQIRDIVMTITFDQDVEQLTDEETFERIVQETTDRYEFIVRQEQDNIKAKEDISTSQFISFGESD